jgi:hypothetical protein
MLDFVFRGSVRNYRPAYRCENWGTTALHVCLNSNSSSIFLARDNFLIKSRPLTRMAVAGSFMKLRPGPCLAEMSGALSSNVKYLSSSTADELDFDFDPDALFSDVIGHAPSPLQDFAGNEGNDQGDFSNELCASNSQYLTPDDSASVCGTVLDSQAPKTTHREKHEWYKDENICERVARILASCDAGTKAVFTSCPDYGTLKESFLFEDKDAERALFVVTKDDAYHIKSGGYVNHPPKHKKEPYVANFPGPSALTPTGPYFVGDRELFLIKRVCTWRGKPKEMDPAFHIWRFDISDDIQKDFWVGLVIPCPPRCSGKRKVNSPSDRTSSRPKSSKISPQERICLDLATVVCQGEVVRKKDELISVLASELQEIINKYSCPETLQRFRNGAKKAIRIRALCVGINYYKELTTLKNCERDAMLFFSNFEKLSDAKATIVTEHYHTKEQIMEHYSKFLQTLDAETQIVFFSYAGHAVQVKGRIYLLPSDINAEMDESTLQMHAISFSEIYSMMSQRISRSQSAVFVLDACRNAPTNECWRLPQESTALNHLLEELRCSMQALTLFSTNGGNLAADGAGDNSLFATILCEKLFNCEAGTILEGCNDACIRCFHESSLQMPGKMGTIPSHLSLRTSLTATLHDVAEQLKARLAAPGAGGADADEPRIRVTASFADLLGLVTGLVSEMEADAGRARVEMACSEAPDSEDARRRMRAYRAQRLLLEVTPVLLGFLLEACWGERGWPLEAEGVPEELRRLVRPGELERLDREGVNLGDWRAWDITTFCAVRAAAPGAARRPRRRRPCAAPCALRRRRAPQPQCRARRARVSFPTRPLHSPRPCPQRRARLAASPSRRRLSRPAASSQPPLSAAPDAARPADPRRSPGRRCSPCRRTGYMRAARACWGGSPWPRRPRTGCAGSGTCSCTSF